MNAPVPASTNSVLTSPLTIAVAVVGALVGALIGSLAGPVGAVLIAVLGALVAVGVRVVTAGAATAPSTVIDPFTVQEPWRRLTQDALKARTTFHEAIDRTAAGPIRERLDDIGRRVDAAVDEVWHNARAGHDLAAAQRRISAESDSARRLGEQVTTTEARLRKVNDDLTSTIALAIELSVSASAPDEFNSIETTVSSIAIELDAIQSAIAETTSITRRPGTAGGTAGGATA